MSKRYTTKTFVELLKNLYGDRYDFSKVEYTRSSAKVLVTCPNHGEFRRSANDLQQGMSCQECGRESAKRSLTSNQDNVLAKLKSKWDLKLDFPEFNYVNAKTKINVLCLKHAYNFSANPSNLLSGKGCPICGQEIATIKIRSTTEEFLEKCKSNNLYTYENVQYFDSKTKVSVTCKIHGDFLVAPSNHLNGNGCRKCMKSGYRENKPGYFYILVSENITKIGVTNRSPRIRAKDISRDSGLVFNVHTEFKFEDGKIPIEIEGIFLTNLRELFESPVTCFDGYTECFYNVPLEYMEAELKRLQPLLKLQIN